jgi:hypothetical protein
MRYLVKNKMVTGLDSLPSYELGPCDGCAKGKIVQAPFPHSTSCAESILGLLHMDLQGPFDTISWLGYRYTLGIIDDNSRHGWKFYLKHKDDAPEEIQTFVIEIENQTGLKVKRFWIDGGGEFFYTPSVRRRESSLRCQLPTHLNKMVLQNASIILPTLVL